MSARYCPDAARIAQKIRVIEESRRPRPVMARYSVFIRTPKGYICASTIEAPTLSDACRKFIRAWFSRTTTCAVVMRAPDGRRYRYAEALAVVEGGQCLSA